MNIRHTSFIILLLGVFGVGITVALRNTSMSDQKDVMPVRIGLITALSGDLAYWGESSLMGAQLAADHLTSEGVTIELIAEDVGLSATDAISAAHKLVHMDSVEAVYSEFNPAAVAISSFLQEQQILHVYDAAPTSPLVHGDLVYKSYLDYEASCHDIAQLLQDRGIKRVAILEVQLEFGHLCTAGMQQVFDEDRLDVSHYSMGEKDFRTVLQKVSVSEPEAIVHVGFQPETFAVFKQMYELDMNQVTVALTETLTTDVIDTYGDMLEGDIFFGLPSASSDFVAKLETAYPNNNHVNIHAAMLAYLHISQLGRALQQCSGLPASCAGDMLAHSKARTDIGFEGFTDRKAVFHTRIEQFQGGELKKLP